MDLIYESSRDNERDNEYIIMTALMEIWDGSQIHPGINRRDTWLKICHRITQKELNGKEKNYQKIGWNIFT